ncbi:MAG: hypothetical protein NVS1B1_11270 [Candidatus Limnocylindrales bacterium]
MFDGPMETIRSGRLEIATDRFWKSVTLAGKAGWLVWLARAVVTATALGLGPAVPAPAQDAMRRTDAMRHAMRVRIFWLTLSREGVSAASG